MFHFPLLIILLINIKGCQTVDHFHFKHHGLVNVKYVKCMALIPQRLSNRPGGDLCSSHPCSCHNRQQWASCCEVFLVSCGVQALLTLWLSYFNIFSLFVSLSYLTFCTFYFGKACCDMLIPCHSFFALPRSRWLAAHAPRILAWGDWAIRRELSRSEHERGCSFYSS